MSTFHHAGINKVIIENGVKVYKYHFCHCGCKERILWNERHSWAGISQYKSGHRARLNKGKNHNQYGIKQSEEWIENRVKQLRGENNCYFGKHPKSEFKCGEDHILYGKDPWNKGIPQSEEAKKNHSIIMQGNTSALGHVVSKKTKRRLSKVSKQLWKDEEFRNKTTIAIKENISSGEDHPRWNGGYDAYMRRRRGLGYVPLNEWFEGCDGHHIDKEHVIYIPHELHKSISHSQDNKESMKKINDAAFAFYTIQFVEEYFPEDLK